ncbi:TIGR03619 family F420-dependent LLM class oxidoreductase [Nocardia aurantiaca]|uniref:TIGR03619 family F420-dependent LLM class oxidoreductase n=1 Tax=Nocardia aurantiaca TaxID=2675850 RepID=A0A6I3L088_9NOCA|nr:TIGR03619 family F420-dependent LLM class oxidoreductase [Nocardia aurantiaca]MTE14066.1 TIGR03619 family F420-dependent LLM class oxidoreductase [Nocardia aurantiaca]
MRLGLSTPIVVQVPGIASPWEAAAGPGELTRIATAADELGFDHLTCSDHVGVPAAAAEVRGATYWDPLATLSYLAAHTTRIRLATSVLVLGYHHPLALAKSYGTLDRLSGGRVVLGVGVGSLAEEFALLGAAWEDRGALADAALSRLRGAWGRREVEGLVLDPHATATTVPIWVGGRTRRSLRRALALGTGWIPFGLRADEITAMLATVTLPDGFDVVLSPGVALDPQGNEKDSLRRLAALRAAGATHLTCAVRASGADHYCDQLAALRDLVDRHLR